MSDRMHPLSFAELMTWIAEEYHTESTLFGERALYAADPSRTWELFGEKMETPFGPAAGPHTQLAQNIIAAYVNGSRFFELKTVQKLDGEDLPVSKPCILAKDEGYNVEWSTELYVDEAFEEYVKAWFALHVLAKELQLGSPDGFIFNMSVGYDLDGIRSPKIDGFIEGLKDASGTKIFRDCRNYLLKRLHNYRYLNKEDVEAIPAGICRSITLSTLHGCPAGEIEKIALYLLEEKGLHTFIKCNPTLLGYDFARETLNNMGYDYLAFTDFHFKDDLQYADAVPMLKRLQEAADKRGLTFGVKLTNTFPVQIRAGELPGEEMYMSGRALYPLSIALAAKLAEEFDGRLKISYSGGADIRNIAAIVSAGIWPVTIATTVLKPGGYARMKQIAAALTDPACARPGMGMPVAPKDGVSVFVHPQAVRALADEAKEDPVFIKDLKTKTTRRKDGTIPFLNCFIAPCHETCPIGQDIPAYMDLVSNGRYADALALIMTKNPLPFTTGTICPHTCMSSCTRSFYETSVQIRQAKLLAAKRGYEAVLSGLKAEENAVSGRIAIVGGGPAGMAAAYFLAKEGRDVTIFTATDEAGGIPLHVIPDFRIDREFVRKDVSFLQKLGVKISPRTQIDSDTALLDFEKVILAVGAGKPGELRLEGDASINAITFLKDFKKSDGKVEIGKRVVVIGGGNTAMDTARAAIRNQGVSQVKLVYRRDIRNMPADEEELKEAVADGVTFCPLLSPVSFRDGILKCEVMELGEPDESGRRSPVPTGSYQEIEADTVIAAIGEKVDSDFYKAMGISLTDRGLPVVDENTMESDRKGYYVIGDGRRGPATVVEAIADATAAAEHILSHPIGSTVNASLAPETILLRKGVLCEPCREADDRCLSCGQICENCVDVCPNRANVAVSVVGMDMPQIIHVDRLCNECGNCASFCPYAGAPYLEKLTLFETVGDMENSENSGFCFDKRKDAPFIHVRLLGNTYLAKSFADLITDGVDPQIVRLIEAVYRYHAYLYA
ncbi:MAG: putative selenate reductase subunit YgfK [Lachnospiraceae bacterium]|nr:putative selenate reductase subunit YgfK [Lachnospiraceae bacterium]